jgi:hypothetical protein
MRKIYYSLSGFLCHLSVFLLASAFTVSYSFAQEGSRMVSGIVTDDTGDEIVGASVTIKGTYTGTSSDAEGKYSLTVPSAQSVLVFTFVGFSSQEILVGNQSLINVILALDSKTFDEVVVVGYGTQKKVNLTGAVGIAGAERLENRPIASVGEGLQGVIPNLNVNVRNGDPSAPITFNIRGYESIVS